MLEVLIMNKKTILSTFAALATSAMLSAVSLTHDITEEIPVLNAPKMDGFEKINNVAQYKNANWSLVVGIAKGVSLEEAKEIAKSNPTITFFFYTKGYQMVLEKKDGSYRVFHHGDAVFFSGAPWWGSAPGLADGYIKK
jgi:hypothetical protein